jgi:TonB family protein
LGGIFISYRRSDSQGEAGRVFDDLVQQFGEQTVFMDVSAIEAGRDFRKAIEEGVAKCGVLLVVIGTEWLQAKDEGGARRLSDPSDFVRIETAAALKRDIPVIPVLVRGARMPTAEQLPEDLRELAYRNCIELTHARWKSDIRLLVEALRRLLADPSQPATSARSNEAVSSAQADAQKAAQSPKAQDASFTPIDPATLQRVSRQLALRIGPIANIVVSRTALRCESLEDLYLMVAQEIDSPREREQFLQERAPIAPGPLSNAPRVTAVPAHMSPNTSAASRLPPPPPPLNPSSSPSSSRSSSPSSSPSLPPPLTPSSSDDVPSKAALPATEMRSPHGRKYLLWAAGGVVVLLTILVLATRFAPSRRPGASHIRQNPRRTAELATAEMGASPARSEELPRTDKSDQSLGPPALDRREPASARRVRVPEDVSKKLLASTVVPVYPVLARQARIQGMVVLDADISRDGAIDALKLVSGHPLLVPAALEAVKQWRYRPYVVNGKPVPVNTQIIVNFTLKGG